MKTMLITDFNRIGHIYRTFMQRDFPKEELKPLDSIRRMWDMHSYDCYQLTENGALVGYALFVRQSCDGRDWYLLDYLAVIKKYRNHGYGSEFLHGLPMLIKDADSIIVEVEDPDKAGDEADGMLRRRRLAFYLRGGFVKTGVTATIFGVPYHILELPCRKVHSMEESRMIYTSLYRFIVPEPYYSRNIRIPGVAGQE